jgi:hypothetical protein
VFSAVTLDDGEAGGSVSEGNIHGPWYFKDAGDVGDIWKNACCGIIPIPATRQAAMGGKFILVGHHQANISTNGPRSLSMYVAGDLPDISDPPEIDSAIFTDATVLYDTSLQAAPAKPNMKVPNFQYESMYHSSNGGIWRKSVSGVVSAVSSGSAAPTAIDDALYDNVGSNSADADCITVRMTTGVTGGDFVPEYYNGTTWAEPPSWAVSVGDAGLSTAGFHVFYWPKIATSNVAPPGQANAKWVRLRQTATASNGGAVRSMLVSAYISDSFPYNDRPEGEGGYSPPGSEQYDETHYAYAYDEYFYGGAWMQTSNVEGFIYFGPLKTRGLWYGGAPAYGQPKNGGTPILYQHAPIADGGSYDNGGRSDGSIPAFLFPFNHTHLLEAAAGTRAKDNSGINPVSFTNLNTTYTDLIVSHVSLNTASPYYGEPNNNLYGWGHCVVSDPVTDQVMVLLKSFSGNAPILAFFQVR